MPLRIDIDDKEIDRVAAAFNLDLTEENRRAFLKRTSSVDVQACPGSGKTTLLVAKLAILADKWTCPDRGICVVSHTNVARRELERRLATHPTGHRLLGYPHFVGTIQVFVDRFLALPYLRSNGYTVSVIDNDRFADKAEDTLGWRRFTRARKTLSRRPHEGNRLIRSLRYKTREMLLDAPGIQLWFGQETATYKQLSDLKATLAAEGYFRFDDMFAFAQALLHEMPSTAIAARHRFPWVFIDEMQDTNDIQEEILGTLFQSTDACILQRLGDANQGIFGSDGEASQGTFPSTDTSQLISIPDSKRFCQEIADFTSPLTVVQQQLVGNPGQSAKQNTVFLFDDSTIGSVLAAFCDLVLNQFPDGLPEALEAKAVGHRRTDQAGAASHVPYCIVDYCPCARAMPKPLIGQASLIEIVNTARHAAKRDSTCYEAKKMVGNAIVHLLRLRGVRKIGDDRLTLRRVERWLESQGSETAQEYRGLLARWCFPSDEMAEDSWDQDCEQMRSILEDLGDEEWNDDAMEFMGWQSVDNGEAEILSSLPQGRYAYENSDDRRIEVEVTTIHAVKGETHFATLVMETYRRLHDLTMLLPELSGSARSGKPPKSYKDTLRRVFVGMTRTSGLLCLALHKSDKLKNEHIEGLVARGWHIVDLTNGNEKGGL